MDEYVGNKIEKLPSGGIKFTQNVIIQSFCNEFKLPDGNANTPAVPGDILTSAPESPSLEKEQKTYFRSGIGKLIHIKQWSRPEISNATRDAARHMQDPKESHINAMHQIMKRCVETQDRGMTIDPKEKWDGSKNKKFKIGMSSNKILKLSPKPNLSFVKFVRQPLRPIVDSKLTTEFTNVINGKNVLYVKRN